MIKSLPTIKRKNYSHQAYDIIEMAIMRGDLKLGEKLGEERIAQMLNISRAPVRESFRILEKYGLVVIKPNNGVWVISPNVKDIEEVYDIRALNQPYALELCFENSREETVRKLEFQIAYLMELLDRDTDIYELILQELMFDEIIFSNCGNKKLIEIWALLVPIIKIGFFNNPYLKDKNNIVNNRSHKEILSAFKEGQIDLAKNLLVYHILESKKMICETFNKGNKGDE